MGVGLDSVLKDVPKCEANESDFLPVNTCLRTSLNFLDIRFF